MRKWLAGLLLICSIVLLSISIYSLMGMFFQEKKDDSLQKQLEEIYEDGDRAQEPEGELPSGESAPFVVDEGILALHEKNPDCIGWLTIRLCTTRRKKIIICIGILMVSIPQMAVCFYQKNVIWKPATISLSMGIT